MQTVREGFADGGYAEAGAVRIPDSHVHTNRYFGPAVVAAGDVTAPRWPELDGETRALDELSLEQLARRHGASDGWLRFLRASQGNLGPFNALAFAGQETAMVGASGVYGLRGGMDQLPAAFAAALGERVRYDAEVLRVDSRPDRVVVGYRDAGGRCHEVDDNGSGELGGLNLVGTDTPAERIWDLSPGQPGPFGMLCAYLIADTSALSSVPPEERADHMLAEVVRFLPALAGNVVASYVKVWAEDRFAGGCCALAEPGQLRPCPACCYPTAQEAGFCARKPACCAAR